MKFLTFFTLCLLVLVSSPAQGVDEPDILAGKLESGRYNWHYRYSIEFDEPEIVVGVAINLIGSGGVSRVQLDGVKPSWEKEIEDVWSNRYALITESGRQLPIIIDADFSGTTFHHDVIVVPGGGRSDELNWHIMNSPQMAAHEFGHMIGVYDEYRGGALDPVKSIVDPGSIMTSNPVSGRTYARHYEQFKEWFMAKTGQRVEVIEIVGE